jgi:transcriptional antiterminator RfaH
MKNFSEGWYLLYTKPRQEKKVHVQLGEMNIHSFLPTTKKLRSWHDRKKLVEEPLFPSYVFIYLKDMENYYNGVDAEGALSYVRMGKDIVKVNEFVVNDIRMLAEKGSDIEVSTENIVAGQKLTIQHGPFTGFTGEVVEVRGSQKILIRVELLQRNLLATFPADCLMPTLN